MATPHTPTPWRIETKFSNGLGITDQFEETNICSTGAFHGYSDVQKANAARIVECVNACEGIEDPKAFIEMAKSLMDISLNTPTPFKQTERIDELYVLQSGVNNDNNLFFHLVRTHFPSRNGPELCREPYLIKEFKKRPTSDEINNELILNDCSRWNSIPLAEGQIIEISEYIYYDLLGALPPRIQRKDGYFEVGEADHHDKNGKPIHRACWIADGKYYTGYPMKDF